MRVCRFIFVSILIVVPAPLFAQQTGTGNTGTSTGSTSSSSGGFSESSSFQGVENVSEQVSSEGSFVGGGVPSAFVGIDEIYNASSASSRSTANSRNRSTTSTRRSTARTTASRRTTSQAGGARSSASRSNSQYVRATATIDFEVPRLPMPTLQMTRTFESNLNRIQGLQNSGVTFNNSPMGTTAVLTGTVASERERRVAQQLLLLEPGVSHVENKLEVR